MTQAFEWISAPISAEQLRAALESLPAVLQECIGDCLITAKYGWGSNLHQDLCNVPMRVETKWASRFIKDSLEQRIFVPAESDLHFELPDGRLRLLFCHDGDVHVSGSDDELRERLFASAALRKLTFAKYRKGIQ
jgi:hypothetical protein